VSAFTGLLFTVMAARWLNPSGFGTWEVIVTLVTFSGYPLGTVAYWATRDVARGRLVGRTALITGALMSSLGLVIYFSFTYFTYSRILASFTPFLLGALLVPLSYWSSAVSAIVTGYRPAVYGISLVTSEMAKLATAYVGLFVYKLGIDGVILALLVSYLVQSLVSTYMVRLAASEKFDSAQVRRWSNLAWLPALNYLPASLAVADTYVVALGYGTALVGTYQVAFTVATVITYASSLAFAMYPLLLRGGSERLPAESLEFSLLFAIPMAVGCVVLASPILFLFGPKYVPGALGLEVLAVMFIFNNISLLLDQTLMGTEKVDVGERPSFRRLVGSNLLFVPLVNVCYGVVYVGSLFFAVSFATGHGFDTSSTLATWATVQLIATFAFMIVKIRRASRVAKLLPGVSVVHYFAAAAVMAGLVYLLAGGALNQGLGTLSYGARLLGVTVLGAVAYFLVVYALNQKFRELTRAFLRRL